MSVSLRRPLLGVRPPPGVAVGVSEGVAAASEALIEREGAGDDEDCCAVDALKDDGEDEEDEAKKAEEEDETDAALAGANGDAKEK